MSDKDFKVKNKLQVKGITTAGPVLSDSSGNIDSVTYLATQYGGTGTTTSPNSGQLLYSSSGSTYTPTDLTSLVTPTTYAADAPSSPVVGQVWIESDSITSSFDPNIIRRQSFTATAVQTEFTTTVDFIDTYEQVFFNGLLLLRTTDYTTSNNNKITLTSGAAAGDIIEVVTVTNLTSTNTYTQAELDAKLLTAVPSQSGNNGKYLTTNGSSTSWGTVDLSSYATTSSLSSYATTSALANDEILLYMGAI